MQNDYMITYDQDVFRRYADAETYAKIVDYDSVSAMWEHCVHAYADNAAILDDGSTYTYGMMGEDVARVRGALAAAGVKKGDKVGILVPNCYGFVRSFLGVTTLGAVAVLMPPQLDAMPVMGICHMMQIRVLLSLDVWKDKTALAVEKLGVMVLDAATVSGDGIDSVACSAEEPCTVLFTGGTTGKSKGALLSNGALLRGTKNGCYGYSTVFGQRYLEILPLTHVFGLVRNMMTSLYTGSEMMICRNNKDMFRDAAAFRPTMLVMVPALAEMALNLSKQFHRNMLGDSVKYIICGAATVPPYLAREYDKLGITLLAGYGLTESANLVSGNPETLSNPTSVGFPFPGQQLRVVNDELWVKGPNMMDGYVGNPEENANAYTDGWFRTGDLVRLDENGYLYITGRIKEIIVLPSGENISPAEVEERFNEIEAVQDSLVYVDHDMKGNEILALQIYPRAVVLKALGITDVESYLKEQVDRVNAQLPSIQRISKLVIRDTDFVRSGAMKILRDKNGTN